MTKKKNPQDLKKVGRKSKKPSISLDKVKKIASFGLTDPQTAACLGISKRTLENYKKDPKFMHALKEGKEVSDNQVKKSLFQRACGYEHEDIQFFHNRGEIIPARYTKRYAPDVTACIFWLKNRDPANWRDKIEHEGNVNFTFAEMSKIAALRIKEASKGG